MMYVYNDVKMPTMIYCSLSTDVGWRRTEMFFNEKSLPIENEPFVFNSVCQGVPMLSGCPGRWNLDHLHFGISSSPFFCVFPFWVDVRGRSD